MFVSAEEHGMLSRHTVLPPAILRSFAFSKVCTKEIIVRVKVSCGFLPCMVTKTKYSGLLMSCFRLACIQEQSKMYYLDNGQSGHH